MQTFHVIHDVSVPEHIPDNKGKPVLAIVELGAEGINIEECVTTAGPNMPRLQQNLVFLLIPDTVNIKNRDSRQDLPFADVSSPEQKAIKRLRNIARTVLAMRKLAHNPQSHGIRPHKLSENNFKERFRERENALLISVTQSYTSLWYPSAGGQIVQKEIRTAGGQGGVPVLEQIRKTLLDDGELITAQHGAQSVLMNLRKLFFKQTDVIALSKLRENFCRLRSWPILEVPTVLDQLIRDGVSRSIWCLFLMGSDENTKPVEFYSQSTGELPFNIDLSGNYSIVTPEGANKRGWSKKIEPDLARVKDWVRQAVTEKQVTTVSEIAESVAQKHGEVPPKVFNDAVSKLVQEKRCMAHKGTKEQNDKPELLRGAGAALYIPDPNDVIITPSQVAEKGWITEEEKAFDLRGKEGARIIAPLVGRIGSLYQRGAKSFIKDFDLTELELPKGGFLRISLADAPPESVQNLGEFFEVVAGLVKFGGKTEAYLTIDDPDEKCPFIKELRKNMKRNVNK